MFSQSGCFSMRANVKCLLERLVMVGEGQGQAGKRRQWARREEEQARLEREAQWLEKVKCLVITSPEGETSPLCEFSEN